MERLEASLEKVKLWTWFRRSMRGLLWVALFASNKERPCLRYYIFVSKRSADALVHSPIYALYAQTVNILAVSLNP